MIQLFPSYGADVLSGVVESAAASSATCGMSFMICADCFLLYNFTMVAIQANPIVQQCKDVLTKQYDTQLKGVILYGSLARGEASPTSDIDLLVLLAPPFDYFVELRRLVDLLYSIQLESNQLISAKPVSIKDFELGSISLYRNIRNEGLVV